MLFRANMKIEKLELIRGFEKIFESDGTLTFVRPIPGTGKYQDQQFAICEEPGYIKIIK